MIWILRGADRETGLNRCEWIEADNENAALLKASNIGLLVSRITRVESDSRLPDCRAMILQNINDYLDSDVVSKVEELPAPQRCDGCVAVEGRRWQLEDFLRELPIPCDGCANQPFQNCRCDVIPVLSDEFE